MGRTSFEAQDTLNYIVSYSPVWRLEKMTYTIHDSYHDKWIT